MAKQKSTSRNWNNEAAVYTYLDAPESQTFVAGKILALGAVSVLDIGCYRGALWGRLLQIGYTGKYMGMEIAGKPLAAAMSTYGVQSTDHIFFHADVLTTRLPPADFVAVGGFFWYADEETTRNFMARIWEETGCRFILVSDPARCRNSIYKHEGEGIERGTFTMPVETKNADRKYILFYASAKEAV